MGQFETDPLPEFLASIVVLSEYSVSIADLTPQNGFVKAFTPSILGREWRL